MQPNDPPFTLLDESAISAADLSRDPFDFCFVEHAIAETYKDDVPPDPKACPISVTACV